MPETNHEWFGKRARLWFRSKNEQAATEVSPGPLEHPGYYTYADFTGSVVSTYSTIVSTLLLSRSRCLRSVRNVRDNLVISRAVRNGEHLDVCLGAGL